LEDLSAASVPPVVGCTTRFLAHC